MMGTDDNAKRRSPSWTAVLRGNKRMVALVAALVLLCGWVAVTTTLRATQPRKGREGEALDLSLPLTVAVATAARAGRKIADLRQADSLAGAGAEPVTVADEASHGILMTMPLGNMPIISEEGVSHGTIPHFTDLSAVVFVDPLDATQEYTEGLTEYVSVQLCVSRCGRTLATVLHFPFTGETFVTLPGGVLLRQGDHTSMLSKLKSHAAASPADFFVPEILRGTCDCDAQRAALARRKPVELPSAAIDVSRLSAKAGLRADAAAGIDRNQPLTLVLTRSHFRNESRSSTGTLSMRTAVTVLQQMFPQLNIVRAGGAGYKLAAIARGDADAYIHDGPIRMWDVCAGAAIVRSAGGTVSDWIGEDHSYCAPPEDEAPAAAGGKSKKATFAVRGIVAARDAALHQLLVSVIHGKFGAPA